MSKGDDVKVPYGRYVSCLVVAAVAGTLLPQVAYAASPSEPEKDDGKSIVDTVAGWFEDDGKENKEPSSYGNRGIADRQKLAPGKNDPKAKRVKELTSRRTPSARFWQLSDGRVEAELSAAPTSYQDPASKSWKSIDTQVRAVRSKGFDFANTANTGRSWFSSDPEKLLRFETPDGDRSVTLGLQGAGGKLKPEAKGATVTYRGAVNGADLEYRVGPGRVKENIVLAERPDGPVKYTFTLDTEGLTPKARKDGSIAFFGELPNTPVLVIPAPYMTDAKKSASSPYGFEYSAAVSQKLTRDGDGWKLTVTPDAKWLAAKERQYPVVVDPTITIAPSPSGSQDTMVLSDSASTNFNSSWKLSVGKTSSSAQARSLLKFPLDEIPAGVKVDGARLGVYFDQTHTTGGNDVTIEAHRATGAWDESTATWSNTSGLVGELSGTSVQADDGDAGTTAATGVWPASGSTLTQYAIGQDYHYNKDSVAGDTYTWQPKVTDTATYRVDVHYVPATDRATNAPYTVTHRDGSQTFTVDQSAGTNGVWTSLNGGKQLPFTKGTVGKVVLGDGPASTSTAVVADAVRLVNPAQIVKNKGEYNQWHEFPVADTVQKWVNGTANHGFVLTAKDESSTAPLGGPRYEAGDGYYGGETSSIPRLTVTWGRVGTALDSPTVVHSTGPELHWPAYKNTSGDTGADIVEYQLHRSTQQDFTPSAATLIAPIDKAATAYTDTTAVPTPDSSSSEIGKSYYYQIAVKTEDGDLLGSPTRVVGIPKAGRTMKIIQGSQGGVTDTTLSSQQPTTNQDTIQSWGVGQNWLSVGNNSGTYGTTRAVLKFPTSDIPATATVLNNRMYMWGAETTTGSTGAIYELHALTRDFAETSATWNNATSTTAWTSPGGDMNAAVSDTVANMSDVGRHWWDATSLMQSWVENPAGNKGVAVRLQDESSSGPQERTLFLSAEAADPQLRPYMQVIYVDSTTQSTYYAPTTPSRMTPNTTYTVDFTVTNTTSSQWTEGERELSYTWKLPDGTDVTTGGNQLATPIPALAPGKSATIQAQVATPINSDSGNKRNEYVLGWDVRKISDGTWLSAGTGGIPALKQNVAVEDPTSNQLGLEKFYSYTGKNTGAGSTVMNNLAAGNSVWQYNAFTNPGRGLSTFARFAYNSQDTSDTVAGHGWSFQAAGPIRLGAPLDFHPNPNPTEIRLPDGDGTTHVFRWDSVNSVWKAPAGVHYQVEMKPGLDCKPSADPVPDAWTLTRPDGTRFLFGCDGYMTSTVDKNGNTQTFTYEERKSNNKPTKFLKYITDPAGRQSLTVDYYNKRDASYEYIDDTGAKVTGSNLTNSKIYDHVKSMTDISGRKIAFYYTEKGLLGQFTDGVGSGQPKDFTFTYDATQGNKNVKLVKATDPRGNGTSLAYYYPKEGDDPKYHWWTQTITDRLQGATGFTYAANATNPKFTDTKVTDAENHATDYVTDDFGRPVQTTNAKSQTSKMSWDADNNVTYLEEANGAKTAYCYDQKTGYPLWQRDAENNKAGVPPASDCAPGTFPANSTQYTYQTRADGFSADLSTKTSPEGRKWQFGYDTFGNLKTVTDPKGVATTTAGDYTTSYDYDTYGHLTKATDANGNPTTNSGFGPTGYPATITDSLQKSTHYVYDERGQVTEVTDALGKKTTQTYDTFGRPLGNTVPKDQATNDLITTPAPVYDANDNVTKSTAPSGAVSAAVYDAADQVVSATAPKDTATSDERKSLYTYDMVGNLKTATEPKGSLTTADPTDYVTTHHYDAIYQLTSADNTAGDTISYEYDNVGNLTTVIDPKKNATADTTDYTTKTAYDLNHRVTTVTDAAGKTTSRAYDKDSLVVSTTDEENNTTTVIYDERGKTTEVKAPHDGTTTITYRTTKYEYDEVGNTTKVITPRGVETATADDFTARTEYDALNRPVKQFQPYDPADARYNDPNVYTETVYDAVGRVAKTSLPPSEGQTVRNETIFSYFDNGWAKSSTDPWDISTTYDYNDLGQQTARTLTSAGGSSNRTMSWSYFPDGKLKSKSDDGVPVGKNVVLVDNSDTQNTSATGTWTTGDITGQQGYDHATHTAGTGTDAFAWTLNIPADGSYDVYVKYPEVSGAATAAKYTLTHATGTVDKTIDQTAAAGAWVPLGSYTFAQGNAAKLELFENSAGTVVADGVKLVRDNSADTDTEQHTFTYAYDVNGNLTSIDDTSSGANVDAYTVTYTGLNQVQKVTEALAGQEKKSTSYTYDANGQTETVTHPDQFSKYTYDLRELVKTVSVGTSVTDASPKVTSYTYTDRGQTLKETKANSNTVDHTYYLDGAMKSTSEKKPNGTLVSSHTYAYDPNGNKAQDVAKKMNADDHAAYLESTTDYTYDPANRLAKSVKTGTGAGTDTYVHDDNANVISQTVKGTSTTYDYDRNRLRTATTSGVTASHNYDPFGRQESVTSGGQVISRSVYDGFDHVVESQKRDETGVMKSTTYTFDPLDRTASKTADGKTTDFTYLGLSGEVLSEEVAGALTKSFQYSPWGHRLSQVKHNTDGTTEDGYYGYNSHTDVETLTDANGDTKATYGYTAYGSDDEAEFTGIDKPDAADPTKEAYNPYRYNAKRWDAQSGTYDMGFRDYSPGLNRFTTRDMYNGALADMGLGTDPFTGNRYAFTGGNPTTFIEYGGHRPIECNESGYTCTMNDGGGWDVGHEGPSTPAPDSTMVEGGQSCWWGTNVEHCSGAAQITAEHAWLQGLSSSLGSGKDLDVWSDWDAGAQLWNWIFGGVEEDRAQYKRDFVAAYADTIKAAAAEYNLPATLVAGVAYNEVSGKPPVTDLAGQLKGGDNASFGNVSMQIGVAADLLGYNPQDLTRGQRSEIIDSLQDNVQNIFLSARYLSTARDQIAPGRGAADFTDADIQNVGAFYQGGPDFYATNPSSRGYGGRIVGWQPMLRDLLG
ncbi:DNRLRE domain-containing protein [Streptomyces peucetius]|uniref:DNRLRE domain-containing protein n=1 Tax=Streptomyces peucetius TaxID=1950 RepID=A0ABY6I344_STRPE|nr:DNRLRE domain-containing protein [Streptomyces peucetius]UYQ60705.1 DNRLRE domain-containing protein [Streptomyces peucetius]